MKQLKVSERKKEQNTLINLLHFIVPAVATALIKNVIL
jgi:hypothetical protein